MVGDITKNVRNNDSPVMTWFGGAACVPIAWRKSDSTITMRVKPVIISRMAGRNDSAVKNSSVWIGTEKLVPPPPAPTSSGRAGPATAGDCASAAAAGATTGARASATAAAPRARLRALFILRASLGAGHAAPAGDQVVHGHRMRGRRRRLA